MKKDIGYIYVFKCIVGSGSDVCKIGISQNFKQRLKQLVRTPYYGFIPYIEFTSGNPIATIFKVSEYSLADELIDKLFKENQFGNFEIYSVDYDEAIEKIYRELHNSNRLLDFIKDDYSPYPFLGDVEENNINTNKKDFERIINLILSKNNNNIPEELLIMLREKQEFIDNCKSHFKTGNYIDFNNGLILNLNYNKEKRTEILNKLKSML